MGLLLCSADPSAPAAEIAPARCEPGNSAVP